MSKKQLYIVIGVFTIIIVGFFLAYFILTNGNTSGNNATHNNTFGNFFGSSNNTNTPSSQNGNNGTNENQNNPVVSNTNLPILRQITKNAVAGVYATQKFGKSYADYIEKETGNVFETRLEDMQNNRLSNSVMPRITEAYFANGGNSIVTRFLQNKGDTISSFILDVPTTQYLSVATTSAPVPNGRFLPLGIVNMIISSDGKTAFYLTKSAGFQERSSFGSIFNFGKNNVSEVFQSPFTEWLPVSFDSKEVLLQTKASQNVAGFLYSFNIKTGILQKIIGDINGLTTLPSPDGQHILYSESTNSGVMLHIYNRADNTKIDTNLQTLPEKCVWKNNNVTVYCATPDNLSGSQYPDLWYQGLVTFRDNIWQLNAITGKASVVLTTSSFIPESLDMTELTLSPLQDFIYFVNKRNSSLWAFEVSKAET